jgi:hypothetical protein
MAEKLDPKELVTFKELLMSEVIQSEALINLLDRKGIISKQELLEEIKKVKANLPESKSGKKRAHSVTKEEAVEIAMRHSPCYPGVTDKWVDNWNHYLYRKGDITTDCWYVTFSDGRHIGASEMIVISKKDGSILASGSVGE